MTQYANRTAFTMVNSRVRWPFRVAWLLMSTVIMALGAAHLRDTPFASLVCLAFGLAGVCVMVAPPLIALLMVSKVSRLARSRVGSFSTWEFDDHGILFCGERWPWSAFNSFEIAEAGLVLNGSSLVVIPAGALGNQSVSATLREMLERNIGRSLASSSRSDASTKPGGLIGH